MTIFTGTQTTYNINGAREDLIDAIYNISPTETPGQSNFGRGSCSGKLHEWQTDSLANAAANAQLEGDDVGATLGTVATSTIRVGNYCQISRKYAGVAGTTNAVNKAGRDSEMAYQLTKRTKELKRDIEYAIFSDTAAPNAGNTTTARQAANMLAWVKTNVDKGASGVNPAWTSGVPTAVRTDDTQRAYTETIVKAVCALGYTAGAEFSMMMVGGAQKSVVSGFAGIATKTYFQDHAGPSKIIGAVDVYVGEFHTLNIVPNRFQRNRDAWFLDPKMAKVCYLRPFETIELAKTGDADKRLLLAEWTLQVNNEAAFGLAADLT